FTHRSIAFVIDVDAVSRTRSLPVDGHPKLHGPPLRGWSQDQVEIARVKTVGDPATAGIQHGGLRLDGPFTGQSPLIQTEMSRKPVRVTGVPRRATRRCEVLCFLTADVRLG